MAGLAPLEPPLGPGQRMRKLAARTPWQGPPPSPRQLIWLEIASIARRLGNDRKPLRTFGILIPLQIPVPVCL